MHILMFAIKYIPMFTVLENIFVVDTKTDHLMSQLRINLHLRVLASFEKYFLNKLSDLNMRQT